MATHLKNLSTYDPNFVPDASNMKFGIVVAEWNIDITKSLLAGAISTLKNHGAKQKNILTKWVPGSFELILGAKFIAEYSDVDAIICLGCVIQGETPHFTYICQGVTSGISNLNLSYNRPFIYGILTTIDLQQAIDRSGGKYGNKGDEAAVTAIKMIALHRSMKL